MISRRTRQHQVFDAAVAVALPLAILGGALALIAIENSLVVVGPLDRAVWGWLTIPLAWAAPVIAGAWWARLSPRTAGIVTFAVIAGCAGVTLASLTTQIGCQPVTSLDALPRMLTVGVVYGAGVALTAAVAASAVRRLEAWWTRGLALLGCAVSASSSSSRRCWLGHRSRSSASPAGDLRCPPDGGYRADWHYSGPRPAPRFAV